MDTRRLIPATLLTLALVAAGAGGAAAKGGGGGGHGHDGGKDAGRDGKAGDHRGERAAARSHEEGSSLPRSLRPSDFTTRIDNRYDPLKPGTVFVYKTPDGIDRVAVTHRTRVIDGVRTVIVKDVETADGEVAEKTLDYFAQDKRGNVWYFGEDARQFENGKVVGTEGSFLAGQDGARPGIVMPAHSKIGVTYKQEDAPGVAEDRARTVSIGKTVTLAFGRFRDILKTFEFSPLEPGAAENKYYAPGVGQVLTIDQETGGHEPLVAIEHH